MSEIVNETVKTIVNIVAVGVFGVFALNRLDGYLEGEREKTRELIQQEISAIDNKIKTYTDELIKINEQYDFVVNDLETIAADARVRIAKLDELENASINTLIAEWNTSPLTEEEPDHD